MCLEEVEEQKLRKINRQERHRIEMLAELERKRNETLETHIGLSLSDFQLPFEARLQMIMDIENEIHICNKQTSDFRSGIGELRKLCSESIQNAQNATSYEDYKKYNAQAIEIRNTAQNLAVAPRNKQQLLMHELFSAEEQVIVNDKLGEQRWLNSKK